MVLKRKKAGRKAAKVKKGTVKKKIIKRKSVKRKVVKRRPVKKAKKIAAAKKTLENVIGTITHYFPKVNAAVIKLKASLAVGDTIKIKGHTTDLTQAVNSMQINHVSVNSAGKGDEIGLLVSSRVRQNDVVCKV